MTRLLERLSNLLTQLPGIGRKTAQRISFHILKMPPDEVKTLATAILEAREKLRFCSQCFNLTEQELCEICRDPSRNRSEICVVETPADIVALERTREFRGLYHVLGGALSPLDDIGPEDLKINELMARLEGVAEVIVATNPTTEGEATAAYLARRIGVRPGTRVTRIARGLPIGSDLDLADEVTLARALEGRKELR